MILKLDPRWPVVWRTPHSAQVGIDPPKAVLENLTLTQERMLSALILGISAPGMKLLREDTPGERDRLLDYSRAGALSRTHRGHRTGRGDLRARHTRERSLGVCWVEVASACCSPLMTARPTRSAQQPRCSSAAGCSAQTSSRTGCVATFPISPSSSATRGHDRPVVRPGVGACLRCIELHHTDADPAWPAIASQLHGLGGGAETPILAAEAAAIAFRMLITTLDESRTPGESDAGASIHIDAESGERTVRYWMQHPECGCGGIDSILR